MGIDIRWKWLKYRPIERYIDRELAGSPLTAVNYKMIRSNEALGGAESGNCIKFKASSTISDLTLLTNDPKFLTNEELPFWSIG